ncbi:MAG TPA: twin-arginine translocation signal domain-containing protein [Allosphingosinicella sp.]|nr:twin-arginine translocation signal domain-containing protein [Allosphingosinicella sp.]
MTPARRLSRRSFLARVAGGSVLAGGALLFVSGRAEAFQCTDADPAPPRGDPSGGGRRCANTATRPRTGCSDGDRGRGSDPGAYGRHCRPATGYTDNDPGDPTNGGRGYRRRECSDSDSGSRADNAGEGRHC